MVQDSNFISGGSIKNTALKCLFLSLILLNTSGAQKKYFSVQLADTFYYFLSNDNLLELSSTGNSIFYYGDEIQGNFNFSTFFAVNQNQLLLVNNDSVSVYNREPSGKLRLLIKQPNTWNFSYAAAGDNNFVINSGGKLKLLTCTEDSIYISEDSITIYLSQFISYPFFVKQREIYKYVPGFGYYLVYTIPTETDPGIKFLKGYKDCIIYYTWKQTSPYSPPTEASLKARRLTEPEFSYYFNYAYWLLTDPFINSTNTTLLDVSLKYIALYSTSHHLSRIYSIERREMLWESYESYGKYSLLGDYIFNYDDSVVIFADNVTDSLNFRPLEYHVISGINDDSELKSYEILQNYPNPFNYSTKIPIVVPVKSLCRIRIYDVLGNEITELINDIKNPCRYEFEFNGSRLSSGVYYYSVLISGEGVNQYSVKKMVILK